MSFHRNRRGSTASAVGTVVVLILLAVVVWFLIDPAGFLSWVHALDF